MPVDNKTNMSVESLTNLKDKVVGLAARRKSSVFNTEELGQVRDSVARMSFSSNSAIKMRQSAAVGKFENTFKMEPDDSQDWYGPDGEHKPRMVNITEMAERVLMNALQGEKYDPFRCRQLCCGLADDIKRRVKSMQNFPQRHKVIVNVYVGECTDNLELRIASRGLTLKFDSCAEAVFRGREVFGVAVVYLVYQD